MREPWRFEALTHLTANHKITFVSEIEARGKGKALGLFKLEDGAVILSTAAYDDVYTVRNGRWKIAARKVHIISAFRLDEVTDLILNGVAQASPETCRDLSLTNREHDCDSCGAN